MDGKDDYDHVILEHLKRNRKLTMDFCKKHNISVIEARMRVMYLVGYMVIKEGWCIREIESRFMLQKHDIDIAVGYYLDNFHNGSHQKFSDVRL